MLCTPPLLELGRLLRGGAVQIHGGSAGIGAAGHTQLTVQKLEVERLFQTVNVHHHRRDIVSGNGAKVHLLLAVVGPHQQRGLVQAGVCAGIAGIAGSGVDIVIGIDGVIVVAPEHQNDRLVHLREVFGQFAQHGICIPDAGSKVFQRAHGAGLEARRVGQHLYALVVRVVVLVIIGMVLHGDSVQEDGLVRAGLHALVLLDDLVGHGIIGDKAAGPVVLAHLGHAMHPFMEVVNSVMKTAQKVVIESDKKCPNCGKVMLVKTSRFGTQFLGCSGYPECKTIISLNNSVELDDVEGEGKEQQTVDEKCEKCGSEMVMKVGPYGKYLECKECKNRKKYIRSTGVKCPKCGEGTIIEKKSKYGKIFFGCNRYPECSYALWDEPTGNKCPECGELLVKKVTKNGNFEVCSSRTCSFKHPLEDVKESEKPE